MLYKRNNRSICPGAAVRPAGSRAGRFAPLRGSHTMARDENEVECRNEAAATGIDNGKTTGKRAGLSPRPFQMRSTRQRESISSASSDRSPLRSDSSYEAPQARQRQKIRRCRAGRFAPLRGSHTMARDENEVECRNEAAATGIDNGKTTGKRAGLSPRPFQMRSTRQRESISSASSDRSPLRSDSSYEAPQARQRQKIRRQVFTMASSFSHTGHFKTISPFRHRSNRCICSFTKASPVSIMILQRIGNRNSSLAALRGFRTSSLPGFRFPKTSESPLFSKKCLSYSMRRMQKKTSGIAMFSRDSRERGLRARGFPRRRRAICINLLKNGRAFGHSEGFFEGARQGTEVGFPVRVADGKRGITEKGCVQLETKSPMQTRIFSGTPSNCACRPVLVN